MVSIFKSMGQSKSHRSLASGYFLVIASLFYFLGIRLLEDSRDNHELWITAGVQLLVAFSISFLNHHFRIIREKSFLPFVFYLLFVSIDPLFFLAWEKSLCAFCILFCFYFLFQSYKKERPQRQALGVGVFLTIGTLFHPSFYILIPIFAFGLYKFKNLTFKTILAAFCGTLLVYLFLFCWCLHQDNPALFLSYFPNWKVFLPELFKFNFKDWLFFPFLLLLLIVSGINTYLAGISEKIKNHVILSFLFFFSLFLLVLILVEFQWKLEWMGFLNLSVSLLLSHFFSMKVNWVKNLLLILSILFFMGIGIWHLY